MINFVMEYRPRIEGAADKWGPLQMQPDTDFILDMNRYCAPIYYLMNKYNNFENYKQVGANLSLKIVILKPLSANLFYYL